jgi:mannose-6-phosphate isomerase-like protein (cupin superfamily)
VPISQLMGEESNVKNSRMLVRSGERKKLANLGDGGLEIQFLSEFDAQNEMEICVHNLKPLARSGVDSYSHDGQEIFYVVNGVLDLSVDNVVYTMREGDCFYLRDCSLQHFFSNASSTQSSSMMCVVVPPFFYTRTKST